MPVFRFEWTDEIIQHLEEHGISPAEFAEVVSDPEFAGHSRRSGDPCAKGTTRTGRILFCVYRMIDELTVEPVTAYEVEN